ncbi:tetratricopeptide repeat (TPR)-like superfamily protein [Tasmannia lanceolata]|uniref:tetratricopeptide repeat (TPR)-like superfamily protein n=1 Tax=Tasmannia lanceolata TaxID=3420 RepID=UPI004063345F
MDHAENDNQKTKTLTSNLQTLSISDPLSPGHFGSFSDLCFEIDSLQDLAFRGSWRSILDKVARAHNLSLLKKPHEHLIYLSYKTLALIKLRKFSDAEVELESLEDFDSSRYRYESYPDLYPNRFGSMVPFSLRWIHADLPQRLGKRQETLDRLYTLLVFVRNKLKLKKRVPGSESETLTLKGGMRETLTLKGGMPESETLTLEGGMRDSETLTLEGGMRHPETLTLEGERREPETLTLEGERCYFSSVSVDLWKKREIFVINSIISNHLGYKEFSVCLELIQDLLTLSPSDPVLLSKLGHIQLQIGDLEGARATFACVEGLGIGDRKGEFVEFKNLVNRNEALVHLVSKDYVSAVREYEECIERDSLDVVAINNKALCLMYLRDLSDSIKMLESALERAPTVALNETLVVNLCSMYELAYVNHSEVKKTLSNWIAQVAPDDFDSSCTRI